MTARIVWTLLVTLALTASVAAQAPHKVMIVTWNGCEEACKGFQAYLSERNPKAIFLLRDANGRKEALADFVAEARAQKVSLIVTHGTNVTLGIAGRIDQRTDPRFAPEIPKVFMIVADPVGAGVVQSLDRTGRDNVTGTYNRVPEQVNIETMRLYRPSFRRLGLLFHADEKNSLIKRDELAGLAGKLGFELIARELPPGPDGRPVPSDIAPHVLALKNANVDFIYVGSSTFLRENGDLLANAATAVGVPVLSPYELHVREGHALLSVAARYFEVGRLAGAQAEKILRGEKPANLPVARMTRFAVTVNMPVARKLKMFPPLEILQIAETVN